MKTKEVGEAEGLTSSLLLLIKLRLASGAKSSLRRFEDGSTGLRGSSLTAIGMQAGLSRSETI